MISYTGIAGSAEFENMANLDQDDLNSLKREITLDPRILDVTNVDRVVLMSSNCPVVDRGFDFDTTEDVEIDDI